MGSGSELSQHPAASTVLVVDDDPPTRRLAATWLEKAGFVVAHAGSGRECLDLVGADPDRFSAVVLDVMMPGMDGFAVLEKLRASAETAAIPVLLLTAHANDDDSVLRGIEQGAAYHLGKPYSGGILVARVRALCEQRDERRKLESRLEHAESLATTDALTGLANRRAFEIDLAREVAFTSRHREPLSLLMLDIDLFKSINDLFGHPAGDRVIAHLGRLLVQSLRDSDRAYRVGGEEFAMVLRGTALVGARITAERVCEAVRSSPVVFESGHEHLVTCSIGVATADARNAFDVDRLVQRADEMLYAAKRDGRDRVSTEP